MYIWFLVQILLALALVFIFSHKLMDCDKYTQYRLFGRGENLSYFGDLDPIVTVTGGLRMHLFPKDMDRF